MQFGCFWSIYCKENKGTKEPSGPKHVLADRLLLLLGENCVYFCVIFGQMNVYFFICICSDTLSSLHSL